MSFQTIYDHALEHPSKPAMVHNGAAISYGQFAGATGATIRYLEALELPVDCTVVVLIGDLRDCWVAVLALQAIGLNTVCVQSTTVLGELRLKDVAGLLTTELESTKHKLEPYAGPGNRIITIPTPVYDNDDLPSFAHLRENSRPGGHILYTSGTTGNYKKLFWTGGEQQKCVAERVACLNYNADTVPHCANFGLWTAVGYKIPQTIWHARGCVILDQRPDWYRHFLQSGMTRAVLIPSMINQLLDSLDQFPAASPTSDFTLTVTSGFISRTLAERLIERVTINVKNSYGSTEMNHGGLSTMVTDLDDLHWLTRSELRTIEIIDEGGNPCPVGVDGEIRIRLTELDCSSYMDDPEATRKVFRDGYYYPGDMAVQRADGRIRILGRSADVINFRGQKLCVAPMEDQIQHLLSVTAACLFSGINNAGEDEVIIAIESDHWPEKSQLNNLGRQFAQFEQVQFALINPFPRTRTGTSKIDRRALRKLIFFER